MSTSRFKVDFFIVGMQRAATTSISQYLDAHPEVTVCTPKEPHYFADDLPKIKAVDTLEDYKVLYGGRAKNNRVLGEASTGYLFSKVAITNIMQHNPEAKIIVLLRNPVDMIHSLHAHLLFCGHEDIESFEEAWSLQEERKKGGFLPRDPRFHPFMQYYDAGCIGSQVKRLLDIFPQEQVKFILFENFIRNSEATYQEILAFLGVANDGRKDFFQVNQNMTYILPFYYQVRKLLSWETRQRFGQFHNKIGIGGNIARRLFSSKKKSPRLSVEMRKKLSGVYLEEITLLSSLIKQDLKHWHNFE
jgi:hypothetical protein